VRPERRRWLGIAGAGLVAELAGLRAALAQGAVAPGVRRLRGHATIGGRDAAEGMAVRPGDTIATAAGAQIVFVVGRDAMLMRGATRVEMQGDPGSLIATGLRVVTGAILSVFAPGQPKRIETRTTTIGIRGTAVYVEASPDRTYVCTCYGTAEIVPVADPAAAETVHTTHHEQPRFVMASGAPQMVMKAKVMNHTDAELTMLEALVGRVPPFAPRPGEKRPPSRY